MKTVEFTLEQILDKANKKVNVKWCPECRGNGKSGLIRAEGVNHSCLRCGGFGRVFEIKMEVKP